MGYNLVRPPPPCRPFRERSKNELKEYFTWFFAVMGERIRQLTMAVRETQGYQIWRDDYSPSSLESLGGWFEGQVDTRLLSQEEMNGIADSYKFPVLIPMSEYTLTERTYSLASDLGMYFGRVLEKNHPSLKWEHELRSRRFADYGQPVLRGFGDVPLNPIRITIVLAQGIAAKKKPGRSLWELYKVWERMIPPE
jgi:hypothetical protein